MLRLLQQGVTPFSGYSSFGRYWSRTELYHSRNTTETERHLINCRFRISASCDNGSVSCICVNPMLRDVQHTRAFDVIFCLGKGSINVPSRKGLRKKSAMTGKEDSSPCESPTPTTAPRSAAVILEPKTFQVNASVGVLFGFCLQQLPANVFTIQWPIKI
ncbi:hypothetical protein BaRGS_00024055 [Batillaria attramentaria]|uniref:Uncharacterized protein n=1 Tax=Batillaria attramentaria TaxID=370345 RepID=A0ABD0KC53_9CAEN